MTTNTEESKKRKTYPKHKQLYVNFIEPNYSHVKEVDPAAIRARFQKFHNELMELVPDDEKDINYPYMYSSHMGEFVRVLDHAKDCFVKALLAYYAEKKED